MGFTTWSEAGTAARDRAGWRRQVNGPILPEETIDIGNKEKDWIELFRTELDLLDANRQRDRQTRSKQHTHKVN